MKVSIVVPSKGCKYLSYLLTGLRDQNVKPNEVVLAVKECDTKRSKISAVRQASVASLIEQRRGFFTHTLNLGKKNVTRNLPLLYKSSILVYSWILA
jgi:hypothetical protein